MCFDTEIFEAKVDENLFCPICKLVLCLDSVQVNSCSFNYLAFLFYKQ